MKPVRCKSCGVAEWGHVCASNKSYAASNGGSNASNAVLVEVRDGYKPVRVSMTAMKQRWSRAAYNRYMRMYMAVKRAVGSGRAEWWPRKVSG